MARHNSKKFTSGVRFLVDFVPLILFFIAFKVDGLLKANNVQYSFFDGREPIIFATFVLVVATATMYLIAVSFGVTLKKINLYSSIAIVLFGILTLVFNDERFIKIKITLINGFISFIIGYLTYKGKQPIKKLIGKQMEFHNEKAWTTLSWRFAMFFAGVAISNEIVWRTFSTSVWVKYKVFVITIGFMSFMIMQLPFIRKNANL